MSVFSSSIQHRSFYAQISMLCFVLGLLLAAAWHTTTTISREGGGPARSGFVYDPSGKYQNEIKEQRVRITELETKLAKGSESATTLNEELQKMKFLLGVTEVEGPGVEVTLADSAKQPLTPTDQIQQKHLIHDYDIKEVVNEMKASGAEAIAIKGQRVVATTAVRCSGPIVWVNDVRVAPPIVIQAIGDAETLETALNMQGGVLAKIREYDPAMALSERKSKIFLPAFAGSTQVKFAKPAETTHKKEAKPK
jgi:uncharacterized protein YlxW (UPF0749 family)